MLFRIPPAELRLTDVELATVAAILEEQGRRGA